MDETEETTETVEETAQDQEDTTNAGDGGEGTNNEDAQDDNANLLKALRAERKLRREAEKRANDLASQQEISKKPEGEQDLERIRREAETAAISKANQRVVRAEFKYVAKGKVLNPDLAIRAIDLSEIEVDEDGNVDADSLSAAIDDFLDKYPDQKADKKPALENSSIGSKRRSKSSEPSAKEIAANTRV